MAGVLRQRLKTQTEALANGYLETVFWETSVWRSLCVTKGPMSQRLRMICSIFTNISPNEATRELPNVVLEPEAKLQIRPMELPRQRRIIRTLNRSPRRAVQRHIA
jgi:hypothetical protein